MVSSGAEVDSESQITSGILGLQTICTNEHLVGFSKQGCLQSIVVKVMTVLNMSVRPTHYCCLYG